MPMAREEGRPVRFVFVLLFFALLLHVVLGTLYCWGNLTTYVTSYLRRLYPRVSYDDTLWAYLLTPLAQAVAMPTIGAYVTSHSGPRSAAYAGGLLCGLCMLACSYAVRYSLAAFVLVFGGMWGTSIGLAFSTPIVAGVTYLPERKGLVAGVVAAAYGLGPFVMNFVITAYVNPHGCKPACPGPAGDFPGFRCPGWVPVSGDDALLLACTDKFFPPESSVVLSVPSLLQLLAGLYTAVACVSSFFIVPRTQPLAPSCFAKAEGPPRKRVASGTEQDEDPTPQAARIEGLLRNMGTDEVMRGSLGWLVWTAFMLCGCVGIFLLAQYESFAQFGDGVSNPVESSRLNSYMSIGNAFGRVLHGALCDRFGFSKVLVASSFAASLLHVTFAFAGGSVVLFYTWCVLISFFYGGVFAIFPTAALHLYGDQSFTGNFGFVFSGFALGALLVGVANSLVTDMLGLKGATVALGSVTFCGFLVACVIHSRVEKLQAKASFHVLPKLLAADSQG
ncbi:monocarboxylate transporter [Diplonema papillatum]|nr:monocarboxylate transporter [Diplonema papillatum]